MKTALIALALTSTSAFANFNCYDVYNYTNEPVRQVCVGTKSPRILTVGVKNARCMPSTYEVTKIPREDAFEVKKVGRYGCGGLKLEKGSRVYIDSVRDIMNPSLFIVSMTFNTIDGTYILPAEKSN